MFFSPKIYLKKIITWYTSISTWYIVGVCLLVRDVELPCKLLKAQLLCTLSEFINVVMTNKDQSRSENNT